MLLCTPTPLSLPSYSFRKAESRLQQKQAVLDVSSRRLRKTQTRIHSIQQQLERYAEYQELQIDQMERRR